MDMSLLGCVCALYRRESGACGPFKLVGKGQVVYRIEYRIGAVYKEGWVKFGGWGGPDWRM